MTTDDTPRPTLADVAARAGVSASTASLAFSGTGPVSDATRERVLQAARELNYAGPDPRARSLRRGRSGIVGVVLEERVRHAFRDPIKLRTLDGLSEEIAAIDAALLLLPDITPADAASGGAESAAVTLADAPLDAAVLLSYSPRLDPAIAALRSRGVPIVAVEADPGLPDAVVISQDNREATRRGAQHLAALGHARVAIVTLPLDREHATGPVTAERLAVATTLTSIERLAGARDVFPDAPAVSAWGSNPEAGAAAARELLEVEASVRPTAIIAQSDLIAAGVIRAAEDLGIAVPAELSVLGFDGVRVEGLWPYELTTLVQPAREKGQAAGRALVALLRGEEAVSQTFTSEFREGNTTAAPARV